MMAQGKSFFAFGDALGSAYAKDDKDGDVQAWFLRSLENLKRGLDAQTWPGAAAPTVNGLWQLPLESWRHTASALTGMPVAALHGAAGGAPAVPWMHQQLERMLAIPGVGYTREHQEQMQKLGSLMIAYQKAFNEYTAAYADMGKRSIERLKTRLDERQAAGEAPIGSTKELFDLWVDCSEEVYAEFVMSDDYVRLHGNMTNALMALKKQERTMLDDGLEAMNLPSRREMDTLLRRFQQARRDEKTLQAETRALRTAQQELKASVAALQKSRSSTGTIRKKTKPRATVGKKRR
jgi:class III poly(R)-hydroxyalkanoic acid synthase PhaE subunit